MSLLIEVKVTIPFEKRSICAGQSPDTILSKPKSHKETPTSREDFAFEADGTSTATPAPEHPQRKIQHLSQVTTDHDVVSHPAGGPDGADQDRSHIPATQEKSHTL